MRDAIDKGLKPTNHTDFVVAPLDQMFMLWSAVNRISRSGEVLGPDQRISPMEGLKAMTINVAIQYGEQGSKGSIENGKLADLVILDKNPLTVDKTNIRDIKVVETIKEGKAIHKRAQWSAKRLKSAPSRQALLGPCFLLELLVGNRRRGSVQFGEAHGELLVVALRFVLQDADRNSFA